MNLMYINTRYISHALYEGRGDPILDDDGYRTGEREVIYSDPVRIKVNASAVVGGETLVAAFGTVDNYDLVVVTDDMSCPIDEHSVLWINTDPDEDQPYDYRVYRVARFLNHIAYAVTKVVEHGQD